MINFSEGIAKENPRWEKLRRTGVAVTTVVLVVYIVAVAGFLGWGAYWSARQSKASSTFDQAAAQVAGLAPQEVVVRKLSDRLDGMQNFLQTRSDLTGMLLATSGFPVNVMGWSYDGAGRVTIKVEGQNIADIRSYADGMAAKFARVQVDNLVWTPADNWVGTIGLRGLKP